MSAGAGARRAPDGSRPEASALVLASTSRYRRELLGRLGLVFDTDRPEVDETALPGETPAGLAARLAEAKARAVAVRHPAAWTIGSDQVADREGKPLGKPGDRDTALAQLLAASGRSVRFHTAWCLLGPAGQRLEGQDLTEVRFRHLEREEILRYLDIEQPYDCAGSFKCEGLGIVLFEAIRSEDPTALVGLPLIALSRALRDAGFRLP